jgi:phosphoribosylanthranilate isomerase
MWIKVCGMTTDEAVEAALAAGVDAIGFVFAESKRQVTPQHALQLASSARGKVRCIAVTRHPEQSAVDDIIAMFKPDVLQTDIEDFRGLNLPATLERLPVVRAGRTDHFDERSGHRLPTRLLFEGPISGTGVPADWRAAHRLARRAELILAGGLSPENVAAAIAEVQPYGVDVSSGVESAPGLKSPQRIASFVRSARAAFRSLDPSLRAQEKAS